MKKLRYSLWLTGFFLASTCWDQIYAQSCPGAFFGPITNLPGVNRPSSIAKGDFNGDGNWDLAVENGNTELNFIVTIYLGNGMGGFSTPTNIVGNGGTRSIKTGDFNNDGKTDLVLGGYHSDNVIILLGNGTGGFSPPAYFPVGHMPWGVAIGDFNHDNNQDLAVTNAYYDSSSSDHSQWHGSDSISVMMGDGMGSFGPATTVKVGEGPMTAETDDFNGDGNLDLAIANNYGYSVSILFGDGNGMFAPAIEYPVDSGGGATCVAIGDFDRNNKPDLAVTNFYTAHVSIFLNNGNGDFTFAGNYNVSRGALGIIIDDLNGDNKQDLTVVNVTSDKVSILMGNGVGGFGMTSDILTGRGPHFLVTGDFNNDNKPDLAVPVIGINRVSLLFNTITVMDTESPVFTVSNSDPSVLTPPNHKMEDITLNYLATDNCPGPITYRLVSVTSNEPDNGTGDGDQPNDIVIVDDHHLKLRAERSGNGSGRIYTISITATDVFGNFTSSLINVTVPHDNSNTQNNKVVEKLIQPMAQITEVSVQPNPTINNYILRVKTSNQADRIFLYVYDQLGILIENKKINNNETSIIGNNYKSGLYFLKVVQGGEYKLIKVIKLSN